MFRHRSRLTLPQIEEGGADSLANARTAAWRFDISSAAGRPLPAMSAIDTPSAAAEGQRVEAIAADAVRGLPRHADIDAGDLRYGRREQAALDQAGVVELALLPLVPPPCRACLGDFPLEDLQERDVLPRLLDEALGAPAHRFYRRVDAAPAGHDDDGEGGIVGADARNELEPFAAGGRVARVVQVHEQQVELLGAEPFHDRVRRGDELRQVSLAGQQPAQGFEHVRLVVGDENAPRTGLGLLWHAVNRKVPEHGRGIETQGACRAAAEKLARNTAIWDESPFRPSRERDRPSRARDCASGSPRTSQCRGARHRDPLASARLARPQALRERESDYLSCVDGRHRPNPRPHRR